MNVINIHLPIKLPLFHKLITCRFGLTGRYVHTHARTHTHIHTHTMHINTNWTHNFSWGQKSAAFQFRSDSMTGGHNSVMSICPACHVYTSSGHRPDEQFNPVVLCLKSVLKESCAWFRKMSFHQLTQTTLAEAICHCSTLASARPMAVGNMLQS